jgi:hypothetical protein
MKIAQIFRKIKLVEDEPKKEFKSPLAVGLNSKFVYSKGSDVLKTFRRHGFVPPSEYREDYLFKKNREMTNE